MKISTALSVFLALSPTAAFAPAASTRYSSVVLPSTATASEITTAPTETSRLLKENQAVIDQLGEMAPELSDMAKLRFALQFGFKSIGLDPCALRPSNFRRLRLRLKR